MFVRVVEFFLQLNYGLFFHFTHSFILPGLHFCSPEDKSVPVSHSTVGTLACDTDL